MIRRERKRETGKHINRDEFIGEREKVEEKKIENKSMTAKL